MITVLLLLLLLLLVLLLLAPTASLCSGLKGGGAMCRGWTITFAQARVGSRVRLEEVGRKSLCRKRWGRVKAVARHRTCLHLHERITPNP